jgi:hypothetical protein
MEALHTIIFLKFIFSALMHYKRFLMVFYNVSEDEFDSLNEDGTSGMTEKLNIQVRILSCFLYNRAILKRNIYHLHWWILSMCSRLNIFGFAATVFALKRSYKYIFIQRLTWYKYSFIQRLTFDSVFISNYVYCINCK